MAKLSPAPYGYKRLWRAFAMMVTALAATPVLAAGGQPAPLPLLFNAQERLASPDLSSLVRLRFLTTEDFPPFNFTDQTGRLSGFNIDLARAICDELGVADRCQVQTMPFGDLQKALEEREGDAVIAGVAVTAALRDKFAFSRPYMMLPARFVHNIAKPLTGDPAVALSGRRVGVVADTQHQAMLASFFPEVHPVPFESKETLLAAVKAGDVDAGFADGLQLSFWTASPAAAGCCALFGGPFLSQTFLGEGMTIMLRQSDTALTTALDHALAALSQTGRLQEIYLKYFPNGLY